MRLLAFIMLFILGGCDQSAQEFSLPEGNVEQGRANFILLQCNHCHSIGDIPWDGAALDDAVHVMLGGKTTEPKTYADLVTSVINPSHKLSRHAIKGTVDVSGHSKMRTYNDVMSVQELIDLVAFLQTEYKLWIPKYYDYQEK